MTEEGTYTELLEILEQALQREIMAAKLYREGAGKANHEKAKELLLRLAKEEERHRDLLSEQYQELAGKALYEAGE
jgi:rubrerythrin